MKRLLLWALSALLLTFPATAQDFIPDASFYGENYWTPDTLGNHRVVISVKTPATVTEAWAVHLTACPHLHSSETSLSL